MLSQHKLQQSLPREHRAAETHQPNPLRVSPVLLVCRLHFWISKPSSRLAATEEDRVTTKSRSSCSRSAFPNRECFRSLSLRASSARQNCSRPVVCRSAFLGIRPIFQVVRNHQDVRKGVRGPSGAADGVLPGDRGNQRCWLSFLPSIRDVEIVGDSFSISCFSLFRI